MRTCTLCTHRKRLGGLFELYFVVSNRYQAMRFTQARSEVHTQVCKCALRTHMSETTLLKVSVPGGARRAGIDEVGVAESAVVIYEYSIHTC